MIFVDDREPDDIYLKLERMGILVKRKRLDTGDYLIKHGVYEVAVERKTASDFLNSIADGRLFTQCHLLSARYPLSFLMIVGNLEREIANRMFRREAVVGAVISVAVKNKPGQVIPLIVENDDDFCLALKTIENKITSEDLRIVPRLKKLENPQIAMLTAIPGIGEEKAKRILRYFGTIQRVANAGTGELMRVSGIGEKQARKIHDFFRTKLKF
jgi:ERCC4-type nuclease